MPLSLCQSQVLKILANNSVSATLRQNPPMRQRKVYDLWGVVDRIVEARRSGRPIIWMMGANVIKCGLGSLGDYRTPEGKDNPDYFCLPRKSTDPGTNSNGVENRPLTRVGAYSILCFVLF